jgi:integrase
MAPSNEATLSRGSDGMHCWSDEDCQLQHQRRVTPADLVVSGNKIGSWGSALLTSDNIHLSRTKIREFGSISEIANDGKTPIDEHVASLVRDSLAGNTRRAYLSDLAHFESWGGQVPATDQLIASYLATHAETSSTATLQRRVASLSKAHRALGVPNPTQSELVKAVLRGIKRSSGRPQKQAKALLRDDLLAVLDSMCDSLKDARDRALLLIGFAGGFRRSELAGLNVEDIESVRQGIIIHLKRSKTDQEGVGRKIGIPFGRTRHCPVTAVEQWRTRSGIGEGALFRPVDRHGVISNQRLSGEAVSLVVKERVAAAGIDPAGYSGHSLRAGLATSAAQSGAASWKIRQQTGHASDAMLIRYIRDGELFTDNVAGVLL